MKVSLEPPLSITCPCGVTVGVPVAIELSPLQEGELQQLVFTPDLTDLWAHNLSHDLETTE